MLTAAERSVPDDYVHANSCSCIIPMILLLRLKVCRRDCATCVVRHKLMQSDYTVNPCHSVKPIHEERALGNHTITPVWYLQIVFHHLLSAAMDQKGLQKSVWGDGNHAAVSTVKSQVSWFVCACVEVWHWYNRKPLTTWRFWRGRY